MATLQPATDRKVVQQALEVTTEATRLLQRPGQQPYHDLPDLSPLLPAARVPGRALEPKLLLEVASFIHTAVEIAHLIRQARQAPRLGALAAQVRDSRDLAEAIRRAILPGGEVADDASPRLRSLRRRLAGLKAQLHSVMESYLHAREADRLLQDKLVTSRNERCVLLVKAEQRGRVPGIVHGSSGSGATLFVEPLPAVELNNDVAGLADEEREEVVRILTELTAGVAARTEELEQAVEILGELDASQARARLALDMQATTPDLAEDTDLNLKAARHPLLIRPVCKRVGMPPPGREPVPVSVRLGPEENALVISGPNTGGKTVALKTVGLLALMAQSGLHIPAAAGSVLPVFQRIYADIGDDQSISASLSTFSAHLAAIVEMTHDLQLPALVLLDEVGAGTDPTEGGALGVAIVNYFKNRGATVMATTHHGLMKAYAQATPGVACASFGYDPETYAPTYELAQGTPGRSLALEMAERLGLSSDIVGDARARLDVRQAQADALLKQLETEKAHLERQREALVAKERALMEAAQNQEAMQRHIEKRKHAEVQALVQDLHRRSEEAARSAKTAIEQAVRRVEASRPTQRTTTKVRIETLRAVRQAHEAALEHPEVAALQQEDAPGIPIPITITVGGRARVRSLGLVGHVLAMDTSEAQLAVSGKRLRVPLSELTALAESAPARSTPVRTASVEARAPSATEINVIGLTVDEALPRVDKLLDDAALLDRGEIKVVHGFGAGRLRRAVAGLLEEHPHVHAFRAGASGEGGGGVTIVELKG